MKKSNRKELLSNVESLMVQYCNGCLLHQHFREKGGRRLAHRFCISKCTVGEKLQEVGNKLTSTIDR